MGWVVRHVHGAPDRLGDVGDDPPSPSSYLVSERAESPGSSRSDRALEDHTAAFAVEVGDRSLLDDESAFGDDDLESGMVEVAPTSSLHTRTDRLEESSAESHDVVARTQGDPIELHGRRWVISSVPSRRLLSVSAHEDSQHRAGSSHVGRRTRHLTVKGPVSGPRDRRFRRPTVPRQSNGSLT